jgi:hypothetical protein
MAREVAREILHKDPSLTLPENSKIKEQVVKILNQKPNWSKIS